MHRILWMKGGALGDFILGMPVLAALREAFSGACVEAVGPGAWLPLVRNWSDVQSPIEGPEWSSLFGDGQGLPKRLASVDLAVVLRPDRDGILTRNLAAAGVQRILQHSPVPVEGCHQVDHLAKVLKPLEIHVPAYPQVLVSNHIDGCCKQKEAILLHPGSGGEGKRWPAERFVRLARELLALEGHVFVVLGPVEAEKGEMTIWQDVDIELIVCPHLMSLAETLSRSRLFVGNDSGVSHLAAAVSCPTLVLFGPSDPVIWAPRGPRVTVLRGGATGGGSVGKCGRGNMADIPWNDVIATVRDLLDHRDYSDSGR